MPAALVVLLGAFGLFLALPTSPAAAQDWVVEIDAISPESGPAGTPILVTGTCLFAPGMPTSSALVTAGRVVEVGGGEEYLGTGVFDFAPNDEGAFEGYVVIPVGFPADDYLLALHCADGDQVLSLVDNVPFVVTEDVPLSPFVVDATEVDAGDTINVSGHCDPTTSTGAVIVPSQNRGAFHPPATVIPLDQLGDFDGPVVIPEGAPTGDYTLGMGCLDQATGTITDPQGAPLAVQGIPPTTTTTTSTSTTTTTVIVEPVRPPVTPRFTG